MIKIYACFRLPDATFFQHLRLRAQPRPPPRPGAPPAEVPQRVRLERHIPHRDGGVEQGRGPSGLLRRGRHGVGFAHPKACRVVHKLIGFPSQRRHGGGSLDRRVQHQCREQKKNPATLSNKLLTYRTLWSFFILYLKKYCLGYPQKGKKARVSLVRLSTFILNLVASQRRRTSDGTGGTTAATEPKCPTRVFTKLIYLFKQRFSTVFLPFSLVLTFPDPLLQFASLENHLFNFMCY